MVKQTGHLTSSNGCKEILEDYMGNSNGNNIMTIIKNRLLLLQLTWLCVCFS